MHRVRALACVCGLFVSKGIARINPVSMPDPGAQVLGHACAEGKTVRSTIQNRKTATSLSD